MRGPVFYGKNYFRAAAVILLEKARKKIIM